MEYILLVSPKDQKKFQPASPRVLLQLHVHSEKSSKKKFPWSQSAPPSMRICAPAVEFAMTCAPSMQSSSQKIKWCRRSILHCARVVEHVWQLAQQGR